MESRKAPVIKDEEHVVAQQVKMSCFGCHTTVLIENYVLLYIRTDRLLEIGVDNQANFINAGREHTEHCEAAYGRGIYTVAARVGIRNINCLPLVL